MTRKEQIKEYLRDIGNGDMEEIPFDFGFECGVEWADAHPNWISVEERLPEENTVVIAYSDLTDLFNEETHLTRTVCYDDDGFDTETKVSHWMPIPNPPTIRERYEHIAKSDYVKEHHSNKSLGDAEEIKDELDCIGSNGSNPFDEVEKQIESQHKKGGKEC